jgi:hypothetical protein
MYVCIFFFTHIKSTVLAGYDGTNKIYMFPNCIKRNPRQIEAENGVSLILEVAAALYSDF